MAAGASVIAASYLGWRIHLESRGIALDSDSTRMTNSFPLLHVRTESVCSLTKTKAKAKTDDA
jgi:hypothetical protein